MYLVCVRVRGKSADCVFDIEGREFVRRVVVDDCDQMGKLCILPWDTLQEEKSLFLLKVLRSQNISVLTRSRAQAVGLEVNDPAAKIDPMANSSEVSRGVADNSTCVTRGVHVETAGSELDQGQVVVSTGEVPAAEIEAETTAYTEQVADTNSRPFGCCPW